MAYRQQAVSSHSQDGIYPFWDYCSRKLKQVWDFQVTCEGTAVKSFMHEVDENLCFDSDVYRLLGSYAGSLLFYIKMDRCWILIVVEFCAMLLTTLSRLVQLSDEVIASKDRCGTKKDGEVHLLAPNITVDIL